MDHFHHFGLAEDPFRSDPVERFNVETSTQADAWRRLDRGVRQAKGLIVLVGGVGSGKTLVARRLYEELEEEVFEASMMVVLRGSADADWLLNRFARELGVEEPPSDRDPLLAHIYERLAIIREDGRHAVLIVDEAHGLANYEALAEVCGLVKLEYEDRRLLTVVLAGGSPLEAALLADPLFGHHVDVKVNLQALDREGVAAYLGQRVKVAGGDPRILLPGAVVGMHEHSGGSPGLLNILADNALYEAYLAGREQVTRSDVDRAHEELGWGRLLGAVGPSMERPAPTPASTRDAGSSFSGRTPVVVAEATNPDPRPVSDLDSELEAVFEPAGQGAPAGRAEATVLMDFDSPDATAQAARPLPASATAAPTEIQLEPADAIGPPPKGDEVDDLFMELLDD